MLAVCHPYWTGPLGMALLDVCLFEDLGESDLSAHFHLFHPLQIPPLPSLYGGRLGRGRGRRSAVWCKRCLVRSPVLPSCPGQHREEDD